MGDCGLTEILEDGYSVPTTGDDFVTYMKKDKLVKNALMIATKDTHAYCFVDATKTGREIFRDIRKAYRRKEHKAEKAKEAFQDLHNMKFNTNSRLSANAFVAKFLSCMKEMAANGTPLWPDLQKSTFLGKITHPDYEQWVEVMDKSDDDLEATTLAFRKKAALLFKANGKGNQGDRISGKVNNADGSKNHDHDKKGARFKGDKNKSKKNGYIQPDQWAKMTQEQRTAHRQKTAKAKQNAKQEKKQDTDVKSSLPMQYNAQANQFVITDGDGNVRTFSQTSSTSSAATVPTNNTQRAANLLQSVQTQGGLFTLSNVKVQISTNARSFVSVQSKGQQVDFTSTMCVDGGTNISLMGRAFRITTWSDRYADMCGFADELIKSNVRIGSGVAVYENNGNKLLIGLHEAPYLENNAGSLLSTGQARENGVWINDVLKHHGGNQRLVAEDENGAMVAIPFGVKQGLFQIHLRYPTEDEVESLPIVWLTSNEVPWNPEVLDVAGELILPLHDGTTGDYDGPLPVTVDCGFVNSNDSDLNALLEEDCRQRYHACQLSRMPELMLAAFWLGRMFFQLKNGRKKAKICAPDYEKYRPLLGWIPLPMVKHTFEATTQLVQELPMQYPLRRHVEAQFPQLNRC